MHIRPLFLALVLIISGAFATGTVFAVRFYQSKQGQLGTMWFGRGQAALTQGEAQAAVQDLRNALYYSHDNPNYRLRLAEALLAANDVPEAQSYLLTLWQDEPSNSTVNLQLARLAAKQGEKQTALRYYHGAIYGLWTEGDATARRRQTRLELIHYLLTLRDNTQADAELIALTPELPSDAHAHTQVGWLFLQAGDQGRALQEFIQGLRLNPRQASALLGAGEVSFQLGQYQNAARFLERATRQEPHNPRAEELLASSRLVLEWNPYAKGLSSRQRALRIVQAFRQATQRLKQCAAIKEINLQPANAPAPPAKGNAAASTSPKPALPSAKPRTGIMAALLGKGKTAPPNKPQPNPIANNANQLQQLYQQVINVKPKIRAYKLERDPQLADLVMGLVSQIESVTAQQCGTPKGADLALLLLARQGEQQ